MKKLLFFGCEGPSSPGHFLSESMYDVSKRYGIGSNILDRIDSTFCPPPWKPGYLAWICPLCKIVAWWDTTGDSRPGSNSVLIGIGYIDFEEMIDDAYLQFPKIMSRQTRPKPYQP